MEGFFLGGRCLPWWAVSGSIMASQISAVTIIAVPGAIFSPGGNLLFMGFTLMMAAVGLGLWLYYRHRPLDAEAAAFLAAQPSRAYPYFIVHELPAGVSGLLIAGIFAAGISTLDSALAALSETTVNGIYRKYCRPGCRRPQGCHSTHR